MLDPGTWFDGRVLKNKPRFANPTHMALGVGPGTLEIALLSEVP